MDTKLSLPHSFVASILPAPAIKEPPCYDVSHWKSVPDWSLVTPRPFLCYTKATEAAPGYGWNHTDAKFIEFMQGMLSINIARGAYHFYRKNTPASKNADHFISIVKPHITKKDFLILDFEENLSTQENSTIAASIIVWLDTVQSAFPDNQLMIYSRKNILDPIYTTAAQRDRLMQIPTISANYPYNPDAYSVPYASAIPDPSRWGALWGWQYSPKGAVAGIIGDVDLNWMSQAWIDAVNKTNTPPPSGDKYPVIHISAEENEVYPAAHFEIHPK